MTQEFFHKQHTLPNLLKEEKTIPLPSQIGPYKIETLLSKGSMSLLYLGIHPETKQLLAVKILSPQHVQDAKAVERFLQEAHIISLTNHPNIVKLYGEGKWEEGLYIAMEWIKGISLRQFIMQQSLSLKRSLEILLQVAYALHHLHSHGVIHRDVKPENILITEDGEVKVIDFGIAQLHGESHNPPQEKQGILGTPNYMSPEQREDASQSSFSSDIYSLGVISYELVLGKLSYGVIDLSLLPKGLRKIIAKALAVTASERYQTIQELITDITQYLSSQDFDRDKPSSDQMKELLETFQKVSQSMSPLSFPKWDNLEIGFAKTKPACPLGLCYDIHKLVNNTYLLWIAEASSQGLEASVHIATLRGMIRSILHTALPGTKKEFHLPAFMQSLQELVQMDPIREQFAMCCLLLDPLKEQMSFISAGLCHVIHLSPESKARKLISSNPLLGEEMSLEFMEVEDNWNIGDILVLHNLYSSHNETPMQREQIDSSLMDGIEEEAFLSAQPQAEALCRRCQTLPSILQAKQAKGMLCLQRIS